MMRCPIYVHTGAYSKFGGAIMRRVSRAVHDVQPDGEPWQNTFTGNGVQHWRGWARINGQVLLVETSTLNGSEPTGTSWSVVYRTDDSMSPVLWDERDDDEAL